jgi:hypothetical protein
MAAYEAWAAEGRAANTASTIDDLVVIVLS